MKELTIEEKAQRYDEAIIEMKPIYDLAKEQGRTIDVQEFERIFPELKESEDEVMIKFIKNQLFNIKKTITENYELDAKLTKAIAWLEKRGESELPKDLGEYIAELSKQFPEVSFAKLSRIAVRVKNWLEKQSTPHVRTGLEWVNTIDDACDKRYSEEYAHGEYCHEQSFKWGFQEGVDWFEKQGEKDEEILFKYIKKSGYMWDDDTKKLKSAFVNDCGKNN